MPGIYGDVHFIIGAPAEPKPVRVGTCMVCQKDCYRETYKVGEGWKWRHYGCEPIKFPLTRQFTRGHIPMSYVPGNFDVAMGRAIEESRKEEGRK